MNKLLLVIDMQKDFINENTKFLIEKIEKLIDENKFNNIVFTRFINNNNSVFYKRLKYTGCTSKEGMKIVLSEDSKKIIDKQGYTALTKECIEYINENNIDEIYLCGIDTECCVLKTAFDMFEAGYNVYVLKDYSASTYGEERHNNAIQILERNIGKEFVV